MIAPDRREARTRPGARRRLFGSQWSRLLVPALGLGLLVALGCGGEKDSPAETSTGTGERTAAGANKGGNPGARDEPGSGAAEGEDRYHDYAVVTERDIFRPLAREAASLREPKSFPDPQSKTTGTKDEEAPKGPTDDVAVTGFVEIGGQLQALVENVETGEGRYVAAGETIFGLTVAAIRRGRVIFEQAGKTYEVAAGEREIEEEQVATQPKEKATEEKKEEEKPEGLSGDMDITRHIPPGMSASQLRAMYERYKQHLSPEQRAQAEEYIRKKEESEGG